MKFKCHARELHLTLFPRVANRNYLLQVCLKALEPSNLTQTDKDTRQVTNDTFRKHISNGNFRVKKVLIGYWSELAVMNSCATRFIDTVSRICSK